MYFLSIWSMCSRARMRNEAMLVDLCSGSSMRASPPNKLCKALVTWADGCEPENVCDEDRNWAYGVAFGGDGDDVIAMCADGLSLLFVSCDVIHGSKGRPPVVPLAEMEEIEVSGKLSESLNPAFSIFSCRRHFARRFWNHTYKRMYIRI